MVNSIRLPTAMDSINNAAAGSGNNRLLRAITALMWIPGFALLLPHGVTTTRLLPCLGIIPLTISALTGLVHLTGRVVNLRLSNLLMDLFCGGFLLSILIATWCDREAYWYEKSSKLMLGAYATVPMLVQL